MIKNFKVLIIGYGSIAKKHYKVLNKLLSKKKIFFLTRRNLKGKNFVKKKIIKSLNPDYFIICSNTIDHIKDIKYIEKNFTNKIVLIEKPLFDKNYNLIFKNNKYLINYQLRFHPIIQKLKKLLQSNSKKLNLQINCNSFLPKWRKRNYQNIYSSKKKLGGGVLLDLSHELDYFIWLFKKIRIQYSKKLKISNLKIDSDDISVVCGKFEEKGHFQINLSYFSKIERRDIILDTDEFSFYGDLFNNFYKIKKSDKVIRKSFKFNKLNLLRVVHKKILNNNFNEICNLTEGNKVLKFIERINNLKNEKNN